MKFAIAFIVPFVLAAQGPTPKDFEAAYDRLDSVTWLVKECKLEWRAGQDRYSIQFHNKDGNLDPVMTLNGKPKPFSEQEAAKVHGLLGEVLNATAVKYVVESMVWWDLEEKKEAKPVAAIFGPSSKPARLAKSAVHGGGGRQEERR